MGTKSIFSQARNVASGQGFGPHDSKVHVTWARFETADVNDLKLIPESAELNGNLIHFMFFFYNFNGLL